ncbi:MAG: hypothetical protein IPK82_16605 [Polyangiaceae bacterium]|nr:hypothetical protein [Polyangiaceae bacterium]
MNQACVSLEEVFAAVGARAASLVPETSGYLALAVADATSRLPYVSEDRAVLLTVDGAVMVPRKGPIASPPDAGKALRDVLRRLLSTSAGSMPGLAAAARPREEVDVERVVSDIEAALIPVNRAAAKRALARLARETLKAKEAGKLRKKASVAKPQNDAPKQPPLQPAAPQAAPPVVRAEPAHPSVPPMAAAIQPTIAAPIPPQPPVTLQSASAAPIASRNEIAPPPMVVAPPAYVAAFDTSFSSSVTADSEPAAPRASESVYTSPVAAAPPESVYTSTAAHIPPEPVYTSEAPNAPNDSVYTFFPQAESDDEAYTSSVASVPNDEAYTSSNDELIWQNADATVADPDAFAVFEAHDDSATAAGSLVAPKDLGLSPPPFEISFTAEPTAGSLTDEDEDALTRPWHAEVAPIAAPAQSVVVHAAAPQPAAPQRVDLAQLDPPTAIPPETGLFSEPAGSRADELLENFGAENHGEPAVLAAARGLRAFAGIEATPAPRSDRARPDERQLPTYARRAAEQRSLRRFDDDEDKDEILPQPRTAQPQRSRWPLAIFALGVLALFAAWLYRPSLAHDLFGLRKWVHLPETNAATSPQSSTPAAPAVATHAEAESIPAVSPRARESKSESGDGAHRRRD